jgi:hypothetical protein
LRRPVQHACQRGAPENSQDWASAPYIAILPKGWRAMVTGSIFQTDLQQAGYTRYNQSSRLSGNLEPSALNLQPPISTGVTEVAMTFDKQTIIDKLQQELDILQRGGYNPSDEAPHWAPLVFRDSVSCPNVGLEFKVEPCSECFLMYFVPPEHRNKENPCHHIPLNERGETVASLSRAGDNQRLQDALRNWLQETIHRLKEWDEASDAKREAPLLTSGENAPYLLLRR